MLWLWLCFVGAGVHERAGHVHGGHGPDRVRRVVGVPVRHVEPDQADAVGPVRRTRESVPLPHRFGSVRVAVAAATWVRVWLTGWLVGWLCVADLKCEYPYNSSATGHSQLIGACVGVVVVVVGVGVVICDPGGLQALVWTGEACTVSSRA